MSELKPCPFCGGAARICGSADGRDVFAECCQCGAQGGEFAVESFAAEAWNNRRSTPAASFTEAELQTLEWACCALIHERKCSTYYVGAAGSCNCNYGKLNHLASRAQGVAK